MECGNTRNGYFHNNALKSNSKLKKYYAEEFIEATGIEIKIQHWGVNRELSMEGIAVEDFTNLVDPGCNETKP